MLLPGLSTLGVLEIVEPWDSGQPFPRVDDRMVSCCYRTLSLPLAANTQILRSRHGVLMTLPSHGF